MAAPPTALSRGSLLLLISLFPSHSSNMVGHTALGAWQRVTWSLCLPYMVGRSLLFQVVLHLVTWLTPNLWWGFNLLILVWWSGVRLINILIPGLPECFIAQSLIYPGFMGKVSTLTHFPLEPGCENYSFLDQAVEDLSMVWIQFSQDSVNKPKLDAFLDEADALASSVSSDFLHSELFIILLDCI